jgi:hypothetical protein
MREIAMNSAVVGERSLKAIDRFDTWTLAACNANWRGQVSSGAEDPANQTPADANWVQAGMGNWGLYNDAQNGDLGGRLNTYGLSAHQYLRETGDSAIGDDIVDAREECLDGGAGCPVRFPLYALNVAIKQVAYYAYSMSAIGHFYAKRQTANHPHWRAAA